MLARPIAPCFAVALLAAQPAGAAALTVTNPGFEDPPLADVASTDDSLPGWVGAGGALAQFNFGAFNPDSSFFPAEAPEGENVAYIQDGEVSQILTDTLTEGTYTLSVLVGQSIPDHPSPFRVQLRAGSTLLAEATSPVAAAGEFASVIVQYAASDTDPALGQALEIVLVDDGVPGAFEDEPYFDSVGLDFEEAPASGCLVAPAAGCLPAAKASLSIQEKTAGKEKLTAKLQAFGGATTQADFGDPVGGATRYDLCVYDAAGVLAAALAVDRAGASCGPQAKPCWKDKSGKGWSYKDVAGAASGVRALAAVSGPAGKGKLQVKASNNAAKGQTALPTGLAAALQGTSSATVQLLTSDAQCYEADLPTVKKTDAEQFKAKAP
jgi:hypothetical protein